MKRATSVMRGGVMGTRFGPFSDDFHHTVFSVYASWRRKETRTTIQYQSMAKCFTITFSTSCAANITEPTHNSLRYESVAAQVVWAWSDMTVQAMKQSTLLEVIRTRLQILVMTTFSADQILPNLSSSPPPCQNLYAPERETGRPQCLVVPFLRKKKKVMNCKYYCYYYSA